MMKVYVFNSGQKEWPGEILDLKLIDLCMDPDDRPYVIVENPYFRGETMRATFTPNLGANHGKDCWVVDID
jgi:hypothetical protein